jgi:formylglycine-generating enzyme required for sulfatase activity
MSADIADRLRALARDHAEGRSSLEGYRRLRAQLLDSLLAPAAGTSSTTTQPRTARPSEVTQPRAPSPPLAPTPAHVSRQPPLSSPSPSRAPTSPQAPTPSPVAEHPETTPPGGKLDSARIAGYVTLAVLLTVVIGFFIWRRQSQQPGPPPVAASPGTPTSKGQGIDAIQALLAPLIENPDWSNARLLTLNEALVEAGQAQIDGARNADWFQAFVESVRSRLREQQALAGAPLTPASSPLAALAVTLGIDLAAPDQPPQVAAGGEDAGHSASPGHTVSTNPPEGHGKGSKESSTTQGATYAAAPAGRKAGASSARQAQSPHPASTSLAGAAPGGAQNAGGVPAQQGGSRVASPESTSAPETSSNASVQAAAHHEYPACSAALSESRRNYCQDFLASGDPGPLMAVIPHGSFMMGNGEAPAESPVHRVTLADDFAMSVYEVSQSEFQLYCRAAGKACPPQPWARSDDPVVNVSWGDARDYAQWLSRATHQRYRLPTEAEWEYAARAGQTGLYPSGNALSPTDAYFSTETTLTAPAPRSMRFNANAWHLMHMVGNAREWVEDDWSETFDGAPADDSVRHAGNPGIKVVRGGCYADPAIKLRLTTREAVAAVTRDRCTGFRLVREIR